MFECGYDLNLLNVIEDLNFDSVFTECSRYMMCIPYGVRRLCLARHADQGKGALLIYGKVLKIRQLYKLSSWFKGEQGNNHFFMFILLVCLFGLFCSLFKFFQYICIFFLGF